MTGAARQQEVHRVTGTYLFAEAATGIRSRAGHDAAVQLGEVVRREGAKGRINLIEGAQGHVDQTWQLFRQYRTLRRLSFIYRTPLVIMRERRIKSVFTGDAHFEEVELGFQIFRG